MYKQRSHDLAVNLGDGNPKYFYHLMRKRQARSYISQIEDKEGNTFHKPAGIVAVFVSHFKDILAPPIDMQHLDLSQLIPHGHVTEDDANILSMPVTITEIEDAIKIANPNKAPGPDGFSAHFYKIYWSIIGNDVCEGIMDFFKHGSMLK